MTISIAPARNEYTANALQTIFNYTFKIFADTELNVYITPSGQDASDSTDITTAYTVTGLGDEDGGTIILSVGTNANDLVTIVSNVPSSRTTDYQNNGDFRPNVVNNDFDRVVSIVKKIEDTVNRSLLTEQSGQGPKPLSLPNPIALNSLRWKSDLSGLENIDFSVLGPPSNAGVITYNQGGLGAVNRTQESYNQERVSVFDYGATGNGVTDDTAAIQAAINENLGEVIFFPKGTYVTSSEILIPFANGGGTSLKGDGRVNTKLLLKGVSNTTMIRLSSSRCTISDMRIEGPAGQTGNRALSLAPEDEAQTTLRVGQDRNLIENVVVGGTFDRGISFITGPDVGGGDSSCFFNTIFNVDFRDNVLGGIVLTDGVNAGSSPSNRNRIMLCEFSGNMNYGIFNEGADTTLIFRCDFEGVDFGVLPFTNPTGIIIAQNAPTSGKDNANVTIESCTFELCTRDVDNSNIRTMIVTSNFDTTKSSFTAQPFIALGGRDFSTTTQRLPGYRFQTNNQEAGLPNSKPVFDSGIYLDEDQSPLENYEADTPTTPSKGTFTPFLADNTDSDSEGQTYSKQVGFYTRIGNRCFFDIRLRTTSIGTLTGAETAKICGLPFTAKNATDYTASASSGFAQLLNLTSAGGVTGIITANQTCIGLRKWTATGGTANLTITEWSADGDLAMSGNYEID